MTEGGDRKRVVILGAGAGGLAAALELRKAGTAVPGVEVTLVDQRDYHHPLPYICNVVSGGVRPGHICFPLHAVLSERSNSRSVLFKQSRVEDIDPENKVVVTDGEELKWDYLVVALGSTTNFFGMSNLEHGTLAFKSVKDAVSIHDRILDNHEAALREEDVQRRRVLLTFVVVGGGATGAELAASIQDFVSVVGRRYPSLTAEARVLLVEARDSLLSGLKPAMSDLAIRRLSSRGIVILLETRVTEVLPDAIETADGTRISTGTVIWVAGVKPATVAESLPFEKGRDGRLLVNAYLEVPQAPGTYVIGDCAYLPQRDGSGPYPQTQQVAERQGPVCARNIISTILGRNRQAFDYRFKGQLIYMGKNLTAAQVWNHVFDGFTGALLRRIFYTWEFVSYLGLTTGLRRKAGAVNDWVLAYFGRHAIADLSDEKWEALEVGRKRR